MKSDALDTTENKKTRALVKSVKCQYMKPDETCCKANSMKNSRYCYFHDPAKEEDRLLSRQRGGRRSHGVPVVVLPMNVPDFVFRKLGDVTDLVVETINKTRKGELDPKVAMTVGSLAGTLVKVQTERQERGELAEERKTREELKKELRLEILFPDGSFESTSKRLEKMQDQEYIKVLQRLADARERGMESVETLVKYSNDEEETMKIIAKVLYTVGVEMKDIENRRMKKENNREMDNVQRELHE